MVLSASQWYNNVCALSWKCSAADLVQKHRLSVQSLGLAVSEPSEAAGSSYFSPSTDTTNSAMCKLWYVLQWQHD